MKIVKYTPERRQDFVDLNVWWIEKYFGAVEQADRDEFDHVEDEIAKGGMSSSRSTKPTARPSPPAWPSIAAKVNGR